MKWFANDSDRLTLFLKFKINALYDIFSQQKGFKIEEVHSTRLSGFSEYCLSVNKALIS